MAVYTEQIATEFNFPNITVYGKYADGELYGYEARPNEGYVMYNPNANDVEFDPETGESHPVIYYCAVAGFPKNYNFAKFPYVAVLRSIVDENYIFGGGDNNEHEKA